MGTGIVDIRDKVLVPTDRHTAGTLDRLHVLIALTQHGAEPQAAKQASSAPSASGVASVATAHDGYPARRSLRSGSRNGTHEERGRSGLIASASVNRERPLRRVQPASEQSSTQGSEYLG